MYRTAPGNDRFIEQPRPSWDDNSAFADADPGDYMALVIPSGRALDHLPNNLVCIRVIQHLFEQEKPVPHLCHGALALTSAGLLKGETDHRLPGAGTGCQSGCRAHCRFGGAVGRMLVSALA
ncbi:MAG TPA: DJ-1/PfpI family protein [Nitrospiraceae bacterium]|nr:DJ-1/PfpI family protein [Nitrospiraceae bacterium]